MHASAQRPAGVMYVNAPRPDASGPIRAGYRFMWILCACAFAFVLCFMLLGRAERMSTESRRVAEVIGVLGASITGVVGGLMLGVAELVIAVLAIIAMARGAVGRGIALLLLSPVMFLASIAAALALVWAVTPAATVVRVSSTEDSSRVPSKRETSVPPTPAPALPPADHDVYLTNKAGKEIKARIVSLSGDKLSLTVDGKPFEIKLGSLSQASQYRVREWVEARRER